MRKALSRLSVLLLFSQLIASSAADSSDPLGSEGKNKPPPPASSGGGGKLPREEIRRVIMQRMSGIRACYEAGLVKNPALKGRVTVRFVIGKNGLVDTADDAGSDMPDSRVTTCVLKVVKGMTFSKPVGGSVSVTYPFVFSPG